MDSTLVLKVAVDELGERCHAGDRGVARRWPPPEIRDAIRASGGELGPAATRPSRRRFANELEVPGFADNPTHRCAMCKTELMDTARPIAATLDAPIALGTNTDDLGDVRPGIAAARERGARMPMVDVGCENPRSAHSRELCAADVGQSRSSRKFCRRAFRTARRSRSIGFRAPRRRSFEDGLRELGFRQLRVRFHDSIARLEIDADELPRMLEVRTQVVALGKRLGFAYIALDLAGFRSGSLNEVLPLVQLKRPT